MPFVNIQMMEGRTAEQKAGLVKDITEAVAKNTGAPVENVHVIIQDMPKGNYAAGGVFK